MPVIGSDLHWLLSSAGASEGGAMSATEIVDNVDENLFEDIADAARIAGWTMIRKLFVDNENGVDSLAPHSLWVFAGATDCTVEVALGLNSADDADPDAGTLVDFGGNAKVALVSNGSDTRVVRLRGKDDAGDPITEDVTLDGVNEVLSVADFSSLYNASADAVSASRTISIKEGAGGTERGTIPVGLIICFRWISGATAKATGIHLTALPTGGDIPIWVRIVGPADIAAGTRTPALKVQTL